MHAGVVEADDAHEVEQQQRRNADGEAGEATPPGRRERQHGRGEQCCGLDRVAAALISSAGTSA